MFDTVPIDESSNHFAVFIYEAEYFADTSVLVLYLM